MTKGNLNENRDLPGVIASKYLMSNEDEEIKQAPQEKGQGDDGDPPPESDLYFQFFDVAELHEFSNELPQQFFEELSQTDQMSIFDNKGVQMLI